jgi:Pyruvate/2-oxoacid:ferredoxin oxidoreductase delta subunit
MDHCGTFSEDLVYFGWAEWLSIKKRKVSLFDHEIIDLGRRVTAKWEGIVKGYVTDHGMSDCGYCLKYHKDVPGVEEQHVEEDSYNYCSGCPIEYFTKGQECIATPYMKFRNEKSVDNAKKMKDFVDEIFIRSLLLIDWRKYYVKV